MPVVSQQHAEFFAREGYLHVPRLLADEITWIVDEFDEVLNAAGARPGDARATSRDLLYPLIDRREPLCRILDLPVVEELVGLLLGPDANYLGSTGGYFVGDTEWHRDSARPTPLRMKVYCNLTTVDGDSGALRVIAGSHERGEHWGAGPGEGREVVLASLPGDVVVFDQTVLHASFGGPPDRRAFTMTFGRRCHTPEELEELGEFVAGYADFGIRRLYSDVMESTASARRRRHLEQPLQVEHRLRGVRAARRRSRYRRATRGG